MSESCRPTIQEFSDEVKAAREARPNPASRVPIPHGWEFGLLRSSLLIEPSAHDFCRLMKAYGYVSHIHEASPDGAPSAFQLIVVLKVPFRYGDKASEYRHSWAFARINAFADKADLCQRASVFFFIWENAFWFHTCFPNGFETVSLGDAATGVIKGAKGDYKTAHLYAWRKVSYNEWRRASPLSFFEAGIEFPTDAIYRLLALGFRNLPRNDGFTSQLVFLPGERRVHFNAASAPYRIPSLLELTVRMRPQSTHRQRSIRNRKQILNRQKTRKLRSETCSF